MSVRVIKDESDFQNELTAAGANLVVVDFTAVWCGPCQHMAPHFETLAAKHAKTVFLKVDVDKCQDIAVSQGVTVMPTFFFYRNGTKIDGMQGADIEALSTKVQTHVEGKICIKEKTVKEDVEKEKEVEEKEKNDDEKEKAKVVDEKNHIESSSIGLTADDDLGPGLMDLNNFILKQGCECLNECDDHPMAHCLTPSEEFYLQSDCDEQLIMSVSFNQLVKLNGMRIKAPIDLGPRELKIFTNITRTLDFELAEAMPCVQELVLEPKDLLEGSVVNLRFVKFQNVQNVQIFVRNNQAGVQVTQIDYVGFVGSPIKTTNMTDFKRVAGKAGEAH